MSEQTKRFPLLKPIDGAAGRTADWRTQTPKIDYEKCTKCNLCWEYCPDDIFSHNEEGYPVIDYEYCKGCLICYAVCPTKAIYFVDSPEP